MRERIASKDSLFAARMFAAGVHAGGRLARRQISGDEAVAEFRRLLKNKAGDQS